MSVAKYLTMKRFCFMCGKEIKYESGAKEKTHFCSPECYMNHAKEMGRARQKRKIENTCNDAVVKVKP